MKNNKRRTLLTLTFFTLLFSEAFGYIPSLEFILNQTSQQHSSRPHQVEQEITFYHITPPLTVYETYTFKGSHSGSLRLRFQKDGQSIEKKIFYNGDQSYLLKDDGSFVKKPNAPYWYYTPLTHNSYTPVRNFLFQHNFIQQSSFDENEREQVLSLDKLDDHIVFALGLPESKTKVFIDQNNFILRKVSFSEQVHVTFSQYRHYGETFWFPQKTSLQWGENHVDLKVTSFSQIPNKAFSIPPLRVPASSEKQSLGEIFDDPIVQEFYNSFR